jgi:Methyltransferase FkbM domain
MSGIPMIRLGNQFDGGYLIPESTLNICNVLISLGYGYDSSLERNFLKINSKNEVNLYDLDINLNKSIRNLVKDVGLLRRNYTPVYYKRFLDYLRVFLNPRIKYRIGRIGNTLGVGCILFADVLKTTGESKVILKMDIEGSEYQCLELDMMYLQHCECLLIEFHNIDTRVNEFFATIEKITSEFTLINSHINNNGSIANGIPTVMELCFIRSSLVEAKNLIPADSIPHPSDHPCNPKMKEITYNY